VARSSALARAKQQIVDARIVDVTRLVNVMVVSDATPDAPPIKPGRYWMFDDAEVRLLIKRIEAAESAGQLARLMRRTKAAGNPPRRTR